MVSGIALSQHIFTFLSGHGGYSLARKTHMFCAYWGYICMAMHLGTNWGVLLGTARKGKKHNLYLSAAGWLLALLGIPTLLRRDLPDYLFLRSHFVFFDYSEPLVIFLTDYLLIAALFIGAG